MHHERKNLVSRRLFLASVASTAAAWPFASMGGPAAPDRRVRTASYPFQLGVASGDPAPDGFVLWTRLAPDPVRGGGMPPEDVKVKWEVARDEGMKRVVRKGTATASKDWAHSVHVEIEGLEPGRPYWYRFIAADEVSPIGRARTTPPVGSMPERMRFAFASCQQYERGYYTALRYMADDDLDAIFHLGDYIYEGGISKTAIRAHNSPEIVSLEDYRNRHALYRSDSDLQAAHASCPWIVTWDDHEVENDYAGDLPQDAIDAPTFLARRAAAYQAYYEHMPLRRACLPKGPMMQLYRSVAFGQLAHFEVLDTRQYRSDQPCGDSGGIPCDGVFDPAASALGPVQEQWLNDRLAKSGARWNVLAQQIMMARVDRKPGDEVVWSMDQWSGYDAGRKRLLQFLADAKVSNPVVLTGDIHTNWVNDLKVDFDNENDSVIATEFVGTSISSGGDGTEKRDETDALLAENPFVKFFNAERGYVRCEITPEQWTADYRVVPIVSVPDGECLTRASFVVENGRPGAERV